MYNFHLHKNIFSNIYITSSQNWLQIVYLVWIACLRNSKRIFRTLNFDLVSEIKISCELLFVQNNFSYPYLLSICHNLTPEIWLSKKLRHTFRLSPYTTKPVLQISLFSLQKFVQWLCHITNRKAKSETMWVLSNTIQMEILNWRYSN